MNDTRSSSTFPWTTLLLAAALAGWWWAQRQRSTGRRPAIPRKYSGSLPGAPAEPETDQEKLDEALAETFPASDPISPSQALRAERETGSARDPVDGNVQRRP